MNYSIKNLLLFVLISEVTSVVLLTFLKDEVKLTGLISAQFSRLVFTRDKDEKLFSHE